MSLLCVVALVTQVQVVGKTVQIPQLPLVEKIVAEIQTALGTQTSENLNGEFDAGHDEKSGQVDVEPVRQHTGAAAWQRQPHSIKQQPTEQTAQEREGEKKMRGQVEKEKGQGERERGERGKREQETGEKGKEVQAETDNEVEKDVTGWTEVTRNKRKKMVQIFVKVDGMKTVVMEVSPEDKVQKILNTVSKSDRDVYVTSGGRILKGSDKLKSCEVRDGSTVEVMSRMRGGGKHKDKKCKVDKKQAASAKTPEQKFTDEEKGDRGPAILENEKEAIVWMWVENEASRKLMDVIPEGSDVEMEQALQSYRTAGREVLGWDQGQADMMECRLRWAVEARRKGRRQQVEEQRRQGEQGQHPGQEESKQDKQVDLGDEEQARAKSTDEPEAMGRLAEVRTGKGSAGLVRGEMRGVGRTRPRKAKEWETEERVNIKAKEEDSAKENSRLRTQCRMKIKRTQER